MSSCTGQGRVSRQQQVFIITMQFGFSKHPAWPNQHINRINMQHTTWMCYPFSFKSTQAKQIEGKHICSWKWKFRFLAIWLTKSNDIKLTTFSKARAIKNMAWFDEKRGSNTYLFLKKNEVQCLFWCCSPIQMFTMVYNDGCLMPCCSAMHENVQIVLGHCWSLVKTEWEGGCTGDEWWFKGAHKDG